jgi:hypothetical protein
MEKTVTIEVLLEHLAKYGGHIVSTNSLQPMWIEQARASNRMYVDDFGYGYVWEPVFKNGMPTTPEEVELFEQWYPLDVELPEELKTPDWLFKAK